MAKVKSQSIPETEPTYYPPGEVVYFGEQYRAALKPATNRKGMAPLDGVVTRTTKGARPATRVKRRNGLWYDPTLQEAPFNPKDIPDYITYANRNKQIAVRIIFNKAAARWGTLKPSSKECWCKKARDAGAKCGCFDFFMRSQLKTFMASGDFDAETCPSCPGPVIYYTTLQMSTGQSQALCAIEDGCGPYTWEIYAGGGQLSGTTANCTLYTAPAQNSECYLNATIRVTNDSLNFTELTIAISHPSTAATPAYQTYDAVDYICDCTIPGCCFAFPTPPPYNTFYCSHTIRRAVYSCAGVRLTYTPCATWQYCSLTNPLGNDPAICTQDHGTLAQCYAAFGSDPDIRTAAAKTAGCCPLYLL